MTDNLSAVDCLRKALANLRDLLNTVDKKYSSSLKWVEINSVGGEEADDRNDQYIKEKDFDVRAEVEDTLRSRGIVEDSMDTTA